jgi:cytochrome P450
MTTGIPDHDAPIDGAHIGAAPTAPGRLPLLGHLLPLGAVPLRYVPSLRRHGPVVRLYFGRRPVYLLTSPPLIHALLVDHGSDTDKGSIFDHGKTFLGEGLVTSAGELHRRQRRMVQPAFHHSLITGYAEKMRQRVTEAADSWHPHQPIELNDVMMRLAFGAVATTMFSVEIPPGVEEHLRRNLPLLIRGAITRAMLPPLVGRLPVPANRRYAAAAAKTSTIIEQVLAQCDASPDRDTDLVSMLQAARDPTIGTGMSRGQLADELLSIMIAGTETTGGALAWVFHDLARHPEVERGVHEELRAVLGDRPIEYADVAKLEYTGRVLNETLRLRSTWLSTRRALRPFQLGHLAVPAGTELAFSLYAMHRDPHVFAEPGTYRVDRWLPPEAARRERGSFIPFLEGNRKCIGDSFAWTELVVTVATIARRWRLRPAPGPRVREVPVAAPRPSRIRMIPVPRAGGTD